MGYELSLEGVLRGGNVTLISGKVSLKPPYEVKLINIENSEELYDEVSKIFLVMIIYLCLLQFVILNQSKKGK